MMIDTNKCIICGNNIPEHRLRQNKQTCCRACQCKTPETRERISKSVKKAYENPELRRKVSERTKEALDNPETRQKRSETAKALWKTEEYRTKVSSSMKAHHSTLEFRQKQSAILKETHKLYGTSIAKKRCTTMKSNGSYSTSSWEDDSYSLLCSHFNTVQRQYRSELYPFNCDFYIPSLDLYIECHFNWTHGGRCFNANNESCKEQLAQWKDKAKTSKYYENAIYTWIDLDIRKKQCAIDNKLNWLCFYTIEDFNKWLRSLT